MNTETKVNILVVVEQNEDVDALKGVFCGSNWFPVFKSFEEALKLVKENRFKVVLTGHKHPNGKRWTDLLPEKEGGYSLIVISPSNVITDKDLGKLVAEVINEGGFDVIMKPFCKNEIFPTLNHAWRHCHHKVRALSSSTIA